MASSSVSSSGTGTYSGPMRNFRSDQCDSSLRGSAVQIVCITDSAMPMQPNVSRSDENGVSRKRSVSQCRPAPSANISGTITASVSSGSIRAVTASW